MALSACAELCDGAKVTGRVLSHRGSASSVVHPSFVGKPHHAAILSTAATDAFAGPPQAIMRIATDPSRGAATSVGSMLWEPGPSHFVGPLCIVPKDDVPGEGWVLAPVFDADTGRSSLAVLDSSNLMPGPVASISFKHAIPHGEPTRPLATP